VGEDLGAGAAGFDVDAEGGGLKAGGLEVEGGGGDFWGGEIGAAGGAGDLAGGSSGSGSDVEGIGALEGVGGREDQVSGDGGGGGGGVLLELGWPPTIGGSFGLVLGAATGIPFADGGVDDLADAAVAVRDTLLRSGLCGGNASGGLMEVGDIFASRW